LSSLDDSKGQVSMTNSWSLCFLFLLFFEVNELGINSISCLLYLTYRHSLSFHFNVDDYSLGKILQKLVSHASLVLHNELAIYSFCALISQTGRRIVKQLSSTVFVLLSFKFCLFLWRIYYVDVDNLIQIMQVKQMVFFLFALDMKGNRDW